MFDVPSSELRKKTNGETDAQAAAARGGEQPAPAAERPRAETASDEGMTLARRRLALLFDPGTFEEIGAQVATRATDFGLDRKKAPGDGVITGSDRKSVV